MSATAVLPPLHNDVVLLRDVPWDHYTRLRDAPENRSVRMYFADGNLLVMTTGSLHERLSRLTALALLAWAEAQELEFVSLGRWTLRQDLRQKGLEADDCYYVSSLVEVQGRPELDLTIDPPPDLAVEIDVTSHSRHKFGIYAALKVPELWVWRADRLRVLRLVRGAYKPVTTSRELPGFPFRPVSELILDHVMSGDVAATLALRRVFQSK